MTEQELNERKEALKSKLTLEFLETLRELGKVIGWDLDYVEVADFILTVHEMAGTFSDNLEERRQAKEDFQKEITPYEIEYEEDKDVPGESISRSD